MKRFRKQACQENVVASFFPLQWHHCTFTSHKELNQQEKSADVKLLVLSRRAWSQSWCKTVSVIPICYFCNLEAHHPVMDNVPQQREKITTDIKKGSNKSYKLNQYWISFDVLALVHQNSTKFSDLWHLSIVYEFTQLWCWLKDDLLTIHLWVNLYSIFKQSLRLKCCPSCNCLRVIFKEVGD